MSWSAVEADGPTITVDRSGEIVPSLVPLALRGDENSMAFARDGDAIASQNRYETYWSETTDSLFVVRVDDNGDFVFEGLNPAHVRRTGLTLEQIAGKRPHDCLPAPIADHVVAQYSRCVTLGHAIEYHETLDLPAGRRHWLTRLLPLRDALSGRIALLLGSAHDITPEREARETAERERRFIQQILVGSPCIIYVFDLPSRRFLFWGGHIQEVLGYGSDQLRAMGSMLIERLIHPDDLARVQRHLETITSLPEGGTASLEYRIIHSSGDYRWISSTEQAFAREADGAVTRVIGVAHNIQAMKAAQQELEEANERMRSILSSISDCYFTLDRSYRITSINESALAWLGLSASDVRGRVYWDLVGRDAPCAVLTMEAMEKGEPRRAKVQSAARPDRWLDYSIYPSAEGLSVFFQDITDREQAQRSLAQATSLLQATLDSLSARIVIVDESTNIVAVNEAWRKFGAGQSGPGPGIGENYLATFFASAGDATEILVIKEGLQDVSEGRRLTFRAVYPVRAGNADRSYRLIATRFVLGNAMRIVIAHEDVTDVQVAQATIDQLSERLLTLQDEERQRIAVELHDSTGQHLTAAQLGLMKLRTVKADKSEIDPLLDEIRQSIQEAQRELRVFTYVLSPRNLELDGLEASLSSFIQGFGRRAGLEIRFEAIGAVDSIPLPLQRALFRISQEALANVHRHASARSAHVKLSSRAGVARLNVWDDGKGIARAISEEPGLLGVGIPGMRARVQQFGGTLDIFSSNRGTAVRAIIPFAQD